MKKLFFVALLGLTIAACSKKTTDAVTPDNASIVAGVYTLSYIRFDSAAIPYYGPYTLPSVQNGTTVRSGTLTATRVTADSVKIDLRYVVPPNRDYTPTYGTYYLKKSGASYIMRINYLTDTLVLGTIDGRTINIDVSYPDDINPKVNDRDVIIGSK